MRNYPDRDPLLNDVFGDTGGLREVTLAKGLADMRTKRTRRRFVRVTGSIVALALIAAAFQSMDAFRAAPKATNSAPVAQASVHREIIEGTPIRVIGDDELLRLFGERPVALAGAPGERRLLLLDEPADDVGSIDSEGEAESTETFVNADGGS